MIETKPQLHLNYRFGLYHATVAYNKAVKDVYKTKKIMITTVEIKHKIQNVGKYDCSNIYASVRSR